VNGFRYAGGNPVNTIDHWGLSPKDVQKILEKSREETKIMTESGHRIDPGWKNDACLYGYYLGLCDKPYYGCRDQADQVKDALDELKLSLDDKWIFVRFFRPVPTHYWVIGVSGNPDDPIITIDPFANEFEIEYYNE